MLVCELRSASHKTLKLKEVDIWRWVFSKFLSLHFFDSHKELVLFHEWDRRGSERWHQVPNNKEGMHTCVSFTHTLNSHWLFFCLKRMWLKVLVILYLEILRTSVDRVAHFQILRGSYLQRGCEWHKCVRGQSWNHHSISLSLFFFFNDYIHCKKWKFQGFTICLLMTHVKKSLHKTEFEFQKVRVSPKEKLAWIE